MVAHHIGGKHVDPKELSAAAGAIGFGRDGLRSALYDLSMGGTTGNRRPGPCPLTTRELQSLEGLAQGKSTARSPVDL